MVRTRQPKPVPPFAAVAALSQRFRGAGGKRILITEDTADLVSRALLAYADMTATRRDDDFNFYRMEAWDALETHSEMLAKCCNSSIALVAFESAKGERPRASLHCARGHILCTSPTGFGDPLMPEERDLHDGDEWSDMAIEDLRRAHANGETVEEAARFLCRATNVAEVAAKPRELGLSMRHENEPRRIDVAYADGHWLAAIAPGDEPLDHATLMHLIKAVQSVCPEEALLFVVDYLTVEYHLDAEKQFLETAEKSGAMVVTSVQEF